LCDAAERKFRISRKHFAHAFVVPTLRKLREEWGTHRVIGTSETKAYATRQKYDLPSPSSYRFAGMS